MIDSSLSKVISVWAMFALLHAAAVPAWAVEIAVPGKFDTIQAAIDAAQPGDVVVVQPGRYHGQVRVAKGVELRSAGGAAQGKTGLARAEATILDAGGKAPAVIMEHGASLNGLTVTGAGKFDQVEFDKQYVERGENLPDNRGAVGTEGGSSAISIDEVDAKVIACIVRDNGHPGIGVAGAGYWAQILDNQVFRNMGGGIGFADGARGRVVGNRCWNNLRAGIGCRAAAPHIENNRCYSNVRAGIGIREGATPLVVRNVCYKNQRAGIGVRMEGTEPHLLANKCYENGMAGIGCRDAAAPLIVENECYKNRLAGIGAMSNARPSIVGNSIYENELAAIGLDSCESGRALIRGNRIVAKTLVCIGIQGGWTVSVEGNEITRVGGLPPLVMVFEGARADFTGNTFEGSGVAAIRSQGQIFVCDNKFRCPAPRKGGPPQNAVWALQGSMLSMTDDNEIQGWREPGNPAVRVKNRAELEDALERAKAGTTILLAPGDYAGGLTARDLRGGEGRPIVIAAAKRQHPPVFKGGAAGLHLTDPSQVELRNLVITGARANGLNIDDGGSFETPAQHVKLSGLVVRDIGGVGNRDGIKLSGVRDFRIEGCRVEHWGSGGSAVDMVGCHDGVIFDSDFTHRADANSASGVQAKGGSSKIAIRRCRFANVGGRAVNLGGSTGAAYFRPRDAKFEASEISVVDCFFEGSMAPVAFVGVSAASVRNNTIYRPRRWIVRILQENTDPKFVRCRDGRFENNLVAFRSDELRSAVNVGPNTDPGSFRFANNEWMCIDDPPASKRLIRLPVGETGGVYHASLEPGEVDVARLKGNISAGAGVRWLIKGGTGRAE